MRYRGGIAPATTTNDAQAVACPHCRKTFSATLLARGRHRGFKCPHCRLFVPESRAEDAPLSRDPSSGDRFS